MVKNPFEHKDVSWLHAQNFATWVEGAVKKYFVAEVNLSSLAANGLQSALWHHATPFS